MIAVNDEVKIYFDTMPPIRGRVVGSPVATGDAWKIEVSPSIEPEGGESQLIYVQQYTQMRLISR